jgi:glucosamine--fructose-6-phosphate aminotransferase (isomerizing)
MASGGLGLNFESEIREQPEVWKRLTRSNKADELAKALNGEVVLLGSGSSLFMAELGALALRRRRMVAHALAATEARLDHNAYVDRTVIAISQSGRSTDLMNAVEHLAPHRLIALTNTVDSPIAARSFLAIDVGAGREAAVPASKSVSATAAILLWAASLLDADGTRNARALSETADAIEEWLDSGAVEDVAEAAQRIATRQSAVILGSDYGLAIARETALKLKEASYLHAEGFAAGEFRHGSVAMIDATSAVIGIIDDDALPTVARPLDEVKDSGALRCSVGGPAIEGVQRLGPTVDDPFNTLGWLVTAQLIALHAGRARRIDSDAPRGLTKALVGE